MTPPAAKPRRAKRTGKPATPPLEAVPVAALTPYAANSRVHTPRQVEQIAASIREFGFLVPVVIDATNGIVAGHGRVLAAQKLGMESVPCIRAAHLTDAQRRAYVIVDNKLAELGSWDLEVLHDELTALSEAYEAATDGLADLLDFGPAITYQVTTASLGTLKSHPRNYRQHPEDQIEHLMQSIREHGIYRNIVVARGNTILAGHGVAEAARRLDLDAVPVLALNIDPEHPKALKLMTADNELGHLGEVNDRALTSLLREILETDTLLGTGYDENMLAGLVFVTRPKSEVQDFDAAAEWVGMPEYEPGEQDVKLIVTFDTAEEREQFCREKDVRVFRDSGRNWSTRWPFRDAMDRKRVRFEPVEP